MSATAGSLHGALWVVTGANSGVGFETARGLAERGAHVVVAGRNRDRVAEATRRLNGLPGKATACGVDVSDFESVRAAAAGLADLGPLQGLVNNAGVMGVPHSLTAEGLDTQWATNHYGPFLLTGLLLPQLRAGGGRVVWVSSGAHRRANLAVLPDPRAYDPASYATWRVYAETKLANLLTLSEFVRRVPDLVGTAAHPGLAATGLSGLRERRDASSVLAHLVLRGFGQNAAAGARPILMAATEPLASGTYCGPSGWAEARGARGVVVGRSAAARDADAARALWELSESTVGYRWPEK